MSSLRSFAGERKSVLRFFTHLICVVMLFVLPEVILGLDGNRHTPPAWAMYAKSAIFVGVFYINYYLIIDRWAGGHGRLWRFIVYNLAVVALAIGLLYVVFSFSARGGRMPPPHISVTVVKVSVMLRDLVMIVLTVGLSVSIKLTERWQYIESRRRDMEAIGREEELRSLKSQLNPHFLFNSLNTVYALVDIDPAKARQAVHTLSSMLRYVLDRNSAEVPLERELEFIDSYVKMMDLRLGGRGRMAVTLDPGDDADRLIAPLLFISLVENVFKHGNTGSAADMFEIRIVARDGIVNCTTANRIAEAGSAASTGIGLVNLRRRLQLLYGDRASLSVERDNGVYRTFMTIDLT